MAEVKGRAKVTVDATEAVAAVAHKLSEVVAVYPITPSTPIGEFADQYSAQGKKNIWGTVPDVIELQSEGGAAGAVHGALMTGAMTTTFTASQGLLLMIPNMYKIAGELTSTVFQVTARSLAAQGLSIYGDHQDVMAVRQTGWALLASNSVQEAQDFSAVATAATLESRVPFMHFFDGFRTSHEVNKIETLTDEDLNTLVSHDLVAAHRSRGLTPENPMIRGTAQNPDVYFQGREVSNPFYTAVPGILQKHFDAFARLTGRAYKIYEYVGAPDADRIVIVMGSGAEVVTETAKYLNAHGEKVGVLVVRMFRPFSVTDFMAAIPASVKKISVLDRTKEPGSAGEPLYQDVATALVETGRTGIQLVGGRYGLSSKEFVPSHVKAIYDELKKDAPKNHFTVGINDDVSFTSLEYDHTFAIEDESCVRCMFWGLGSDGTVGANKNSIKIIGEETDNYAQGYFFYDSKKSGGITVSHLRFGPNEIKAPYLITKANFIAVHKFGYVETLDTLAAAAEGSVALFNAPYGPDEVWEHIPAETQKIIIDRKVKLYVIDAFKVAKETGMGTRINTVMQTCFFAISGVLPREAAIDKIKASIKKAYIKKGEEVVKKNWNAVDQSVANMFEVKVPATVTGKPRPAPVPAEAPEFVRNVLGPMIAFEGDILPVSAMPIDGTFPVGTAAWEKRGIALDVPEWNADICISCGKCSLVCPHAVIRQKLVDDSDLVNAPSDFKAVPAKFFKEFPGKKFTIQVSAEDCTGCELCVEVCPAKDKSNASRKAINMEPIDNVRAATKGHWDFFLSLPDTDRTLVTATNVKGSQMFQPLFEFSGACSGCGETPYVKLVSQLFGDRAHIANATGCSSIYSGNLPTTPYTKNAQGRGPTWANSLFEDNAEFGLGMRMAVDKQTTFAQELLKKASGEVGDELVTAILSQDQTTERGIADQRLLVKTLKEKIAGGTTQELKDLLQLADALVKRSIWIMGGDGWAYDIGYGGLDHVISTGKNVNILVLDTEVYSNTGGQASKSTPIGAVAKFSPVGKALPKKDMGMIAMAYGYVYVAKVAMGANDVQTIKAFLEAESFDGPSIIFAYSHCISHGIAMNKGFEQQKLAVQSGHWPLYRYDPRRIDQGLNPLQLDSKEPSISFEQYAYNETRYKMLKQMDAPRAEMLLKAQSASIASKWAGLASLAAQPGTPVVEA
jgi:pyruvate-ferredoxin/flavodoxin oxidoreductase